MKLSIKDLRTERQWRAATGLDEKRFQRLLRLFKASYLKKYGYSVGARQAGIEVTPSLQSEEDLLYFTLFSLKSGLTYDLLGVVCGMDGSNAKRNQEIGLAVLKETLVAAGYAPKREFKDAAEFAAYLKKEKMLLLDGTEQRIQRPGAQEEQKACYSGKKCHTVKVLVISNKRRKILYVSKCWVGKVHDFKLLKEEFPPEQEWFKNFQIRVDLGYLGFDQEYECKALSLPHKKAKKQELSVEQKQENSDFARERVEVEHAIGGLKRYRSLSERLRAHDTELYNDVVEVCAGLWNFYLTH